MANEKVDVVIVGGGASGILLAAKLGQAGKKVVILEMGPPLALDDLVSSQIWSRRLKWGGVPVVSEGKNPVAHNFQSGWGLGGAAMHQFANWPRFHPEDFRVKSQYGRGLDWPISYDDMRPYYDRIQKEVGLSGDHVAEVWRPAGDPYPMPPIRWFRQAELLAEGFRKIGMRTAPMPLAINSVSYNGRPACIYDGWCHIGCPIGALSNPIVTYLGDARHAGAEVRARSTVTRVLMNKEGTKATGVEYYDASRQRHVQPASAVVLAAWSAQNPRLLLNSATPKHAKGLANASGLVGKYMMCHFASGTWALFDEDVQNHMGTTGAQFMSYDRYPKTSHKGAFGSTFIVAGSALKTTDLGGFANARLDLYGPELHAFMKRAARGLTRVNAFGEELPNIENRVELAADKDEFGMPLGRIVHSFDEDAAGVWNANFEEGLKIAKATGAKEAWSGRGAMPTIHLMGGTIMGTTARNSVVNSYGQTHEIANLWIAGPGIFPTAGASNPTYTIFALSLRGAEQLAAKWATVV